MRLAPILVASTAPLLISAGGVNDLVERPPNVIVILADDLGWGELGCYGQEKIRTPKLDALASQGVRFTQHYSGSPVCAPSRCVLLTGLHTGHAVVRDNWENGGWGPDEPEGQYPLPDGTVTLAGVLQEAGYATGAVGKWGLGGPGTSGHPNRQGFDLFYGYLCQRKAHNYFPTHLWRNDKKIMLEGNDWFSAHHKLTEPLPSDDAYAGAYSREQYAPDLMLDEALEFMREHADEPFFLFYASPIPHVALQVPQHDVDAYPVDWDEAPYLGQQGYLPHPRPRAAYAAMISRLDAEIGALLELLEELDLSRETIVLFTSDNGPTWAGGVDADFFRSAGGLRGLKGSLWEGGIRVPLIARWPDRIPAGTSLDDPSSFEDLLPTVLDLVGLEERIPEKLDGRSLAGPMRGRPDRDVPARTLYWELRGQQAVRLGRWKGIRTGLKKADFTIRLFDLDVDPAETTDLAEDHPRLVSVINALMKSLRRPSSFFRIPALDGEDTIDLSD